MEVDGTRARVAARTPTAPATRVGAFTRHRRPGDFVARPLLPCAEAGAPRFQDRATESLLVVAVAPLSQASARCWPLALAWSGDADDDLAAADAGDRVDDGHGPAWP